MKLPTDRPLWLRKRFLFPIALIIGLGVTATIAFVNSDVSTIVVYNETSGPLPPLLVRACGQERSFPPMPERGSVRVALKPVGSESVIHLELATEPPWQWEGELVSPRGGQRVTLRLWRDGQVEAFSDVSWWRK